jgi:hypothetical protein
MEDSSIQLPTILTGENSSRVQYRPFASAGDSDNEQTDELKVEEVVFALNFLSVEWSPAYFSL